MSKGELEFDKSLPGLTGYYIMPNGETELDWTFTATTIDGIPHTQKGVIKDRKIATKYTLYFDYNELVTVDGGLYIDFKVIE